MPIYEYQCQACQTQLEKLQRLSDDPLTDCPECHQPTLKKKISAAGFRLSGSGWYETDFKKGDKKKNLLSSDNQKTESSSGEKTPKAKTESGASKSEAKPSSSSADKN